MLRPLKDKKWLDTPKITVMVLYYDSHYIHLSLGCSLFNALPISSRPHHHGAWGDEAKSGSLTPSSLWAQALALLSEQP